MFKIKNHSYVSPRVKSPSLIAGTVARGKTSLYSGFWFSSETNEQTYQPFKHDVWTDVILMQTCTKLIVCCYITIGSMHSGRSRCAPPLNFDRPRLDRLRGGGGGVLPLCILGMCRARDPHFQPWISVPEHIIFTNYQKIRSGASPFYIFGGFCRSGDHHFQNFFNFNPFVASHGRLSPNAMRSAAPRVRGRSGDSHFHAQNGSSSFRRFAFSRQNGWSSFRSPAFSSSNGSSSFRSPTFSPSTGSPFRSPCPFFTLPGHIPTKIWSEYPPPPPPPGIDYVLFNHPVLYQNVSK